MKRPIIAKASVSISCRYPAGGGCEYTIHGIATDDNPAGIPGREVEVKLTQSQLEDIFALMARYMPVHTGPG